MLSTSSTTASNFPLKNLAALHMRIANTHNTNLSSRPEPPFLLEDIAEYLRSKFGVFSANIKQRSAVCGEKLEVSRILAYYIKVGFRLKNKSTCSPPSWIIQRMKVLLFKHKMWLRDWFSSFPNGLVAMKRLQTPFQTLTVHLQFFFQVVQGKCASTASKLQYTKQPTADSREGHLSTLSTNF